MRASILALDRPRLSPTRTPELGSAYEEQWVPPRMSMALVAGYCDETDLNWTLLGRHGGPVRLLTHARLFQCSPTGYRLATAACMAFCDTHCPDALDMLARVIVTGDWDEPTEVVEAWRLEGSKPVHVEHYPFE